MVLTNFECWAHGDPATAANFETGALRPAIDPFNPRAVTHLPAALITDADANNNNNSFNSGPPMQEVVMPMEVRCKKRLNPNDPTGGDVDHPMYTKRCRYDEADLAAQYCNDFFSLPATQIIGTQACLMDYEMQAEATQPQHHQQLQQQHQQQQQQQQLLHQRIHQHYQEPADQQASPRKRKSRNDLEIYEKIQKCNAKCSETEADLYIATHGGCLHHFRKLSGTEQEESDI
ncbi:hypothetical protein KR067_003708 [Drosophila pandora]|nr:hypothetical protein KR067_003708 [Drosophila pandora]